MARNLNPEAIKLIKQWEAFIPYAYDDFDPPKNRRRIQPGDKVNGTLTIGYGTTGPDVKPGMTVTEAWATERMLRDLYKFRTAVDRLVKVDLTDNQFGALVSFCYNVGEKNFAGSTLLKKLNAGDYGSVPKELLKWVNSKGKRMQGLVNRRNAEIGLWNKGEFVSSASVKVDEAPAETNKTRAAVTVATGTTSAVLVGSDAIIKAGEAIAGQRDGLTSGDTAKIVVAVIIVLLTVWSIYRQYKEQ